MARHSEQLESADTIWPPCHRGAEAFQSRAIPSLYLARLAFLEREREREREGHAGWGEGENGGVWREEKEQNGGKGLEEITDSLQGGEPSEKMSSNTK